MTPTITTQRLTLRALTKATQQQVTWLRDPDVVKYSEQRHNEHTLSTQLRYINAAVNCGNYLWGIYEIVNGEHIGNMSATLDRHNGTADIGILIGERDLWKRGFGLEAWKAATNWLLDRDYGKLRKLEAGCASCNVAMKRIMEKTGFQFEGEKKNHVIIDGSPYGALFYGRFK